MDNPNLILKQKINSFFETSQLNSLEKKANDNSNLEELKEDYYGFKEECILFYILTTVSFKF